MTDRSAALQSLAVGDMFHGEGHNGARLICVVTAVTDTTIQARTVTSQFSLEFDRDTGIGKWGEGTAVIDSIAALPTDIRDVLLGLDRRYSLGDDPRLRDTERRALLFVGPFYAANPL